MNQHDLLRQPLKQSLADYPWLEDFFSSFGLRLQATEQSLQSYLDGLDPDQLLDLGISQEQLQQSLHDFLAGMLALDEAAEKVESLTIIGGFDKTGTAEQLELTLKPGEVICIVGPTGSGKSRLL
ncbi:MAG: ABC transporter ATP-binding protein, partial [Trichlorobacter sp.]|nr:ABC transporter ATP-binding protein [Trichlorobacter sp.]